MILIAHMPESCPRDKVAASHLIGETEWASAGTVIAVWEDAALVLKQPVPTIQHDFKVCRVA